MILTSRIFGYLFKFTPSLTLRKKSPIHNADLILIKHYLTDLRIKKSVIIKVSDVLRFYVQRKKFVILQRYLFHYYTCYADLFFTVQTILRLHNMNAKKLNIRVRSDRVQTETADNAWLIDLINNLNLWLTTTIVL